MPELETHCKNGWPFSWEGCTLELWRYAVARISDCDPAVEKYSVLCVPVLVNKNGDGFAFRNHIPIEHQIILYDFKLGVSHIFCGPYFFENDNDDYNLVQLFEEIEHSVYSQPLTKSLKNCYNFQLLFLGFS